jgi:2'-5' RNA ligase
MSESETIRVFIALDISEVARSSLSGVMDRLRTAIPRGARWVDAHGIHLTLKFLGNIDSARTDGILESLCRIGQESPSLSLRLAGLGVFPNQREPRVLWAGVEGEMEPLASLQEKVEAAMADHGFTRERRGFNPHLTIGRVRDRIASSERQKIGATLLSHSLEPTEPWTADTMHLFRTTFTSQGSIHDIIGSAPLLTPHG